MTTIEWTDATWNPVIGCSRVPGIDGHPSGCDNCYAEETMHRFGSPRRDGEAVVRLSQYDRKGTIKLGNVERDRLAVTFLPRDPKGKPLGKGARWTGAVWLLPDVLEEPLARSRKPTTYFVNSVSDAFHEAIVGDERGRRFLAAMFGVMAACPQHTFQLLTKRPEEARAWFEWLPGAAEAWARADSGRASIGADEATIWRFLLRTASQHVGAERFAELSSRHKLPPMCAWPLPNVLLGTSVSTQPDADKRVPELLRLPAVLHFISAEPLLGPVDLGRWLDRFEWCSECRRPVGSSATGPLGEQHHPACSKPKTVTLTFGDEQSGRWCRGEQVPGHAPIGWVIAGGESRGRECDIAWIRSLVRQCADAGVACFVKQLGSKPLVHSSNMPTGSVLQLQDSKGGDMAEWPADLRVRQMPEVHR